MDISYILEFTALAETKSFRITAYQLHVSQATLSRHIQTMEQELGHLLFIRSTRNVELSDFGRIYLPYAKQISESVQKAHAAKLAYEKQCSAKTIIGIARNPDLFMAVELITGFRRKYPDIPIQVFEGSLRELREEFQAGHLHIISMVYSKWETPQNEFIPAGESRLAVVMPLDHPLAAYQQIPLKCLENIPLLVPEETSFPYQYLLYAVRQENIELNIVYQGNTTGIGQLLKEGMGLFIQDAAIARTQMNDSLTLRILDPDISYTYGLEHHENLTKNETVYVKYIKKQLSRNTEIV